MLILIIYFVFQTRTERSVSPSAITKHSPLPQNGPHFQPLIINNKRLLPHPKVFESSIEVPASLKTPWLHYPDRIFHLSRKITGPEKRVIPGVESIAILIKTSKKTAWSKLPAHILSTFHSVSKVRVYGDTAFSIAGLPVYDAFARIKDTSLLTSKGLRTHGFLNYLDISGSSYDLQSETSNELDRFKEMWMLYDAWLELPDAKWFVILDDNTAFWPESLVAALPSDTDPDSEPLYIGSPTLPGFAQGTAGIAINQALLNRLFSSETNAGLSQLERITRSLLTTSQHQQGDEALWRLVSRVVSSIHSSSAFQSNPSHQVEHGMNRDSVCAPLATFQTLTADQIVDLDAFATYLRSDYDVSKGGPILYADHFRYFVAPYLTNSTKGWDNRSRKRSGTSENVEECRESCVKWEACSQWMYDPFKSECWLEENVIRGEPAMIYSDDRSIPGNEVTSGWLVERIETKLQEIDCVKRAIKYGWWWDVLGSMTDV